MDEMKDYTFQREIPIEEGYDLLVAGGGPAGTAAAGTAAVQTIEADRSACDIDVRKLTASLRKQGAYLPEPLSG